MIFLFFITNQVATKINISFVHDRDLVKYLKRKCSIYDYLLGNAHVKHPVYMQTNLSSSEVIISIFLGIHFSAYVLSIRRTQQFLIVRIILYCQLLSLNRFELSYWLSKRLWRALWMRIKFGVYVLILDVNN